MIQTYSTTIRRKEMDAVLTCMVDERIGPGELNARFIQTVKEFFGCDGAVALRNPASALKYALRSIGLNPGETIMISALAPAWHYQAAADLGYKPLVLDVDENSGLVNAEIVKKGIESGGRLLLLHESMGILPEIDEINALGIPVIEDVSKSAGAYFPTYDENNNPIMKWIGLKITNVENIKCNCEKSKSGRLEIVITPKTVIHALNYYNYQDEEGDYWYQIYAGPQNMYFDYEILKEKRKKLGFTQKQVSDAVGTSVRTYQKWEVGDTIPDGYFLIRLLNWLDIPDIQNVVKYL